MTSQEVNTLKVMEVKDLLLDLQNLVTLFGSSGVNGMTPHLYLSIIPFWKQRSELKVNIKKVVEIEQQVIQGSGALIAVLNGVTAVNSAAFSSDGTRIVSGADDRTVRIWNATTGTQIGNPLHGHDDSVWSVAFSPDGTRIVSGSSDMTVRLWNATNGTQIGDPFYGHEDSVLSVAFYLMNPGLCLDLMTEQ
ncbi:hypothetical protein GYMLUDRAFT_252434 [Collybiopsis luxurians FD-317 M1]|uniref:WD40 repeat-like protein n=1 Tax=Collybiopsis luxurians FD-317 M1 TaxID=944289 RepID=A0A0D0B9X4_9AGAR|nr:hypothetical protein GYMLUDRAFT_252434 [Collybiopsis luxurians FD-317 M1]